MKNFTFSFCLSLGLSLLASSHSLADSSLFLQPLQADTDFVGGCGCGVGRKIPGDFETLAFSELGVRDPLVVKVKGQVKSLAWVSSTQKDREPRLGDKFTRIYSDGDLRVTLDHKTTFVCGEKDEGCEVTAYKTNVKLEQGREKATFKGLEGDCGC